MIIKMVVDNKEGTAEVKWIPANNYGIAHYSAFITVPYQPSSWVDLYIHNKSDKTGAIENAKSYLQNALKRCTLC